MDSNIYKLTTSLKGHDDDVMKNNSEIIADRCLLNYTQVRSVLFPSQDIVISVSRDATVRLWRRSSENPTKFKGYVNSTGGAFINAVAYMEPTSENPKGSH